MTRMVMCSGRTRHHHRAPHSITVVSTRITIAISVCAIKLMRSSFNFRPKNKYKNLNENRQNTGWALMCDVTLDECINECFLALTGARARYRYNFICQFFVLSLIENASRWWLFLGGAVPPAPTYYTYAHHTQCRDVRRCNMATAVAQHRWRQYNAWDNL